jgi:7,8-dihydro-6-hydroxymethylpterin-pyrophosphokinase
MCIRAALILEDVLTCADDQFTCPTLTVYHNCKLVNTHVLKPTTQLANRFAIDALGVYNVASIWNSLAQYSSKPA